MDIKGAALVLTVMLLTLFFLSGYNNTRIKTLSERIDQLEVYHEIRQR